MQDGGGSGLLGGLRLSEGAATADGCQGEPGDKAEQGTGQAEGGGGVTAGTTGAEGVDRETLSKALPRLRGWGDEGLRGSRLRGDRRRC